MRVLQIAAPGSVGGLESVLILLSTGLRRIGVQVAVAPVLHGEPERHPVVRALRDQGVEVLPVVVTERGYLRERSELKTILERFRPQIVHTHGYRSDLLAAPLARRAGIPTVTTVHGPCRQSVRTAVYEWLQFRAMRKFEAVLAVSRPLAEELERVGVPSDRVHILPNALRKGPVLGREEARTVLGLSQEGCVIGWVGRLVPAKGCDLFLHALARLKDLPVRASIIGDGPEREALQALAKREGIADLVSFHGERAHARELLPAFNVWALTSRSEGTPIALLEAMAAGVPVVATRVGGVEDIVSERDAFLVPPGDPEFLALTLRGICTGAVPTADRVRSGAARLVRERDPDRWIDRHLEIYAALASHPSGRPDVQPGASPSGR